MTTSKITLCELQKEDPIKYKGSCSCDKCKAERVRLDGEQPKQEGFHTYDKIWFIGHDDNKKLFIDKEQEVKIEEKVDGGNARWMVKTPRIIFGSRTRSIGDSNNEIGGNWTRYTEFIKEKVIPSKELEGYIFYGEAMLKHSIDYDWKKTPPFIGFDIFNMKTGKYVDYDKKVEMFAALDIPIVPLIKTCKIKDLNDLDDSIIPKSKYYPGPAEGVVIKAYNYDGGKHGVLFAKLVSDKFKEVNKEAFGMGKKHATNDDELIVAMFCPNPRIDKIVFKLVDDGCKLDLSLMGELCKTTYKDMMEECWKDIVYSRYTVNFVNVKKLVSKRCKNVLQQIMINTALNKK